MSPLTNMQKLQRHRQRGRIGEGSTERSMRINSDYLGGDPDYPAGIKGGSLTLSKGGLLFTARNAGGGIWNPREAESPLNYPARDLRGVSFADPVEDSAATIARTAKGAAVGLALGGNAQGAAAGAYLASRMGNHSPILYVACQQRGQMFIASFTIKASKVNELLAEIQQQRAKIGLARLPSVESLVEDAPAIGPDGTSNPNALGPAQLQVASGAEAEQYPWWMEYLRKATIAALDEPPIQYRESDPNWITVDEQTGLEIHETYITVRVLPLIDATPAEIMQMADVGKGPARFELKEGIEFSTVHFPIPFPVTREALKGFVGAAKLSAMRLAAGLPEVIVGMTPEGEARTREAISRE